MTDIQISKIDPAKFNPISRTAASALASLRADIAQVGILSPIHLVPDDGRFTIADGHRRFACARMLELKSVPAVIHEEKQDVVALWARLNRSTRKISGYEWLCMWWATGKRAEKNLPPTTKRQIDRLVEIFGGREEMHPVLDHKASPSIVQLMDRLDVQLRRYPSLKPWPSQKDIVMWIMKHKMGHMVSAIMGRAGVAPLGLMRKLLVRIRKDVPFVQGDFMSRRSSESPT